MFGHLGCSDELVRVDNYSDQLAKLPDALAVIVIYAGRNDTMRGEVVARLFGIRDRLLKKRSIDTNRIVLLDGGFREKQETELWITSNLARESLTYLAVPNLKPEEATLRRPALHKRQYACSGDNETAAPSNKRLKRTRR